MQKSKQIRNIWKNQRVRIQNSTDGSQNKNVETLGIKNSEINTKTEKKWNQLHQAKKIKNVIIQKIYYKPIPGSEVTPTQPHKF
jgi:hypothetical protein